MFEKIAGIVAEEIGCEADSVTESALIMEELGADSLDMVEIVMTVEDLFNISVPDAEIPNLKTVRDIIDFIETNS